MAPIEADYMPSDVGCYWYSFFFILILITFVLILLLVGLHVKFPDVITKDMLHHMTSEEDVAQAIITVNRNSVLQEYSMFLVLLKF